MDQLEGQMASLKVQLSRLATKESFWVFSGNDFNLKVSDKTDPSYLIIANNPKTQSMNSALNALIINRLTRLVNTKGNYPTSIIVDECPTLYFINSQHYFLLHVVIRFQFVWGYKNYRN